MAQKQQFTLEELNRMNKPELIQLAESLHIKTQNLSKSQIIKYILGQRPSNTSEQQVVQESDTVEVFEDPSDVTEDIKFTTSMLTVPLSQVLSDLQSISEAQLRYNLELKRLVFEVEERRIQAEERKAEMEERKAERQAKLEAKAEELRTKLEMEKSKMEFDLRALEINARARPPPDSQSTFRVETAAKLLPKLASEQELEIYLITFRKIASLNNWPKEHWSGILQTQLKGKALRVFAKLPDSVVQDFDQLQAALLAAYKLIPEHYRKKFRDIRKLDSENFADFAFKMQNFFKHWLQSIDSYDEIDKLRRTLMMEQFL